MSYEEEIDLLRNEIFEFRKGEDTRIVISELMARIDVQADRIAELEAQVAALKEIAVEGHAKEIYPFIMPMWKHLPEEDTWIDDKLFGKSKQVGKSTYRYHARSQLAEEHPEAFR